MKGSFSYLFMGILCPFSRRLKRLFKCLFKLFQNLFLDHAVRTVSYTHLFSRLSGEFIRTKVVPELDAFRFASYAGKSGISKAVATDLPDGASVLAALRVAITKMDEDEVPTENRHLFITPTLDGMIADLDTTKSREILTLSLIHIYVDTYGKKKAAPGACAEGLGGSERRAAQHPRVRARADGDGRGHVAAHRRREG